MAKTDFYVSVGYGYDNDIDHRKSFTLTLPAQFTEEDVEALVRSNYKEYRTVSVFIRIVSVMDWC